MIQSVSKVSKVQPPNCCRERIEVRMTEETACRLRAADFTVTGQTVEARKANLSMS